jgi:uncharacterized protein
VEQIAKLQKQYDEILKRKETILKAIDEQKVPRQNSNKKSTQVSTSRNSRISTCPTKRKKKTRADVARENGLEPLAKIIMAQNNDDVDFIASRYLNTNVKNEDEALQGARDIIAEWTSENIYVRKQLRRVFNRKASISTQVVKTKKDSEDAQKFSQYFDWSEPLTKAPAHRLLAMLRAENEGFVKLKVAVDPEPRAKIPST